MSPGASDTSDETSLNPYLKKEQSEGNPQFRDQPLIPNHGIPLIEEAATDGSGR